MKILKVILDKTDYDSISELLSDWLLVLLVLIGVLLLLFVILNNKEAILETIIQFIAGAISIIGGFISEVVDKIMEAGKQYVPKSN